MVDKKYKAKIFNIKNLFLDFSRLIFVWKFLLVTRPKYIYESKEAKKKIKGGALVACNHVAFTDPAFPHAIHWYRRTYICASSEVFGKGLRRWIFKHLRAIEIPLGGGSFESFKEITSYLKGGNMVYIYPQGHIDFKRGHLMEYKGGTMLMAATSNVPVIPIYREKRRNFFERNRIVIGNPIRINELCHGYPNSKDIERLNNYLYAKELQLRHLYHKSIKNPVHLLNVYVAKNSGKKEQIKEIIEKGIYENFGHSIDELNIQINTDGIFCPDLKINTTYNKDIVVVSISYLETKLSFLHQEGYQEKEIELENKKEKIYISSEEFDELNLHLI